MDCSPPGSYVQGILQARIWSGLPIPSPEDLPDPLQVDSLLTELQGVSHATTTTTTKRFLMPKLRHGTAN